MIDVSEIPFEHVVQALLDDGTPFPAKYVYRLSDISPEEQASLAQAWLRLALLRRQAVMEDVQSMGEADNTLDFKDVSLLALVDDDPYVRLQAVRTLGEYEATDLLPTFIKLANGDPNVDVRAASASALGTFVYMGELEEISKKKLRQVEDCLLNLTRSEQEPKVRRHALESLGFSSRDEVPDMIETAYNQGDRDWLVSSLLAMGRSSNERWNPQVLEMLEDRRPDVRAEAAAAAGELTIRSAIRKLASLLDDPHDDVRAAAIWALSEIGGEGVRRRLEALAEKADDDDELELIESALDNLTFTEDFQNFAILELGEEDLAVDDSLDDEDYLEDDYTDFLEDDDENNDEDDEDDDELEDDEA